MSTAPPAEPPPSRRARTIGWLLVAAVGAAVLASFVVPFGADETASAGAGPRGPRAVPVRAVEVKTGPITQRGRYPGELIADAADVAAFYAGRVVDVRVRVGDPVTAGQVLAELDPVDAREQIAQARAQAKAAAAEQRRANVERDAALAEVARMEPLARDKLISTLEIDRLRARAGSLSAAVESAAAGQAEANARIKLLERRVVESAVRAPFAGRVAERYADPGTIVAAGARLLRIVETAPLRVRLEVPEQDIARLSVGSTLLVETQAGTSSAPAKVTGIASEVNRARRIVAVEALVETPPDGWLPGMYAETKVDIRTIERASLVPAAAVLSRLQDDGQVATGLFVAAGKVARWLAVKEVARDGDVVAIEPTPPAGTRVLVAGHVDLVDGAPITVAEPRAEQP